MSRRNTKHWDDIGFVFPRLIASAARPATPAEGDALVSVRALRISVTLWLGG
jgi:hypothetical protein